MTKADLRRARTSLISMSAKIKVLDCQVKNLRDLATHITPAYSITPKGGGSGDKISSAVVSMSDYLEELLEYKTKYALMQRELTMLFLTLPDSLQAVMIGYYVNCQSWEDVAEITGYSVRHIYRLHGIALKYLQNSDNVILCQF